MSLLGWAAAILAAEFGGGLALYYALSAASFRYFFVRRRADYFPSEPLPDPDEIKKAQRLALWGTLGNAVLALPLHLLAVSGHSKIYLHVADRGWGYFIVSGLAFLAFTETVVYWAHRALHHPLLYKHLHRYHHQFRRPNPWVSMAFHPLDSFAQAFPHYLFAVLFPLHVSLYVGSVLFVMLWTFFIHDRVTFVDHPLVNYTAHHTLHHLYNKYNLGQFFTVWDRIGGTYRNPKTDRRVAELVIGGFTSNVASS